MKRLVMLVLLALIFPILTVQTTQAASEYRKIKIAVLDFQQNGAFDSADVGKIVAEWLTTSLVETGRFDVIERRLLQQIVEEQKMGKSGLIDPGSASRLGRLLGVKTVVSGTVQSYEGTYEINARLINVETGSIITAEKISASSTTRLPDLVSRISAKIMRHFPLQGYVVQRSGDQVFIDLGMTAGVRPGMLFSVYTEGAPIRHPKTGEILSIDRKVKGTVQIREVKEKTSLCSITKEQGKGGIKVGNLITGILAEDEELAMAVPDPLPPPAAAPARTAPDTRVVEKAAMEEKEPEKPKPAKKAEEQIAGATYTLVGHTDDIKSIAFSPDGSMAVSGDSDKAIILWDTANWSQLATLKGHSGDVQALQFSPDSRILASGSRDNNVILWNILRREQMLMFKVKDKVNSVDFNPSGSYLATGANSKDIILWDIRNATQARIFKARNDILTLDFSPNGRHLATAGKNRIIDLWDIQTGKRVRSFEGHTKDVRTVIFSPGGKLLISAGEDKKIIVWDAASGRQIRTLNAHDNDVIALAISRDGHRLVSAQSQRSGSLFIVWDVNKGREVKRIKTDKRSEAIALSPNGRFLLAGRDKLLLVFRLD